MQQILIIIVCIIIIFFLSNDNQFNKLINNQSLPLILLLVFFYFVFNKLDIKILFIAIVLYLDAINGVRTIGEVARMVNRNLEFELNNSLTKINK